ncbi:alpha/beta fold hydrolase [Streptomyces sp. NBC_01549]|uniref:alpha/beta fold hydrolase n=1 Tax=Streptomyces sp. NBC_01549 TaxID=2975874 RepID=UPI002B1CD6CB|nr:alpha/beta fold hydrolase [Streptomyces sp. NBC_01549]
MSTRVCPPSARTRPSRPPSWTAPFCRAPSRAARRPARSSNIQPEHFHSVFCADLPDDEAAVLAVSQRPAADVAFGEPLAVEPGWKRLPSWFVVAGADHAINPDAERAAAKRMGSTVTEIAGGSHAIALSHADEVAQIIVRALGEIG